MAMLNEEELARIEQQLRLQREALQAHLRGTRRAADAEQYLDVAGTVHSHSDESFAELSTALRNANLGRDADALRKIEEALDRIRAHSYGYCVDCGQPIALERLRTSPTAKRCLPCQQHGEDRHGGKDPTPSL